MHSNTPGTDRNTEPTPLAEFVMHDYDGREDHFIGDSSTATTISNLWDAMERCFDEIKMMLRHTMDHTPDAPVEGCEFCEVRRG